MSQSTFPYNYDNYYTDDAYFSENELKTIFENKKEIKVSDSVNDLFHRSNWKWVGKHIDRQFGTLQVSINNFPMKSVFYPFATSCTKILNSF